MAIDRESFEALEAEHRTYGVEIVKQKFFPEITASDIKRRSVLRDKVEKIDPVKATAGLYSNDRGNMAKNNDKSGFWTLYTMMFAQWGAFRNTGGICSLEEDDMRKHDTLVCKP